LSSGISANILDFRIPQKHVLPMREWSPAARPGGGGPGVINSAKNNVTNNVKAPASKLQ
jgi:hypothetical protein